jgi:hypothetical protein
MTEFCVVKKWAAAGFLVRTWKGASFGLRDEAWLMYEDFDRSDDPKQDK